MNPKPIYFNKQTKSGDKLLNKIALITGVDSGIGRAIACANAQ
jgi:NADP-dependent 3-hydroxy acid dehydrogenase YdfG